VFAWLHGVRVSPSPPSPCWSRANWVDLQEDFSRADATASPFTLRTERRSPRIVPVTTGIRCPRLSSPRITPGWRMRREGNPSSGQGVGALGGQERQVASLDFQTSVEAKEQKRLPAVGRSHPRAPIPARSN